MKTFQVLRDLCARIATAVRWLSNLIRVPAAGCTLAVAVTTIFPAHLAFADVGRVYVNIAGTPTTEDGTSWANAYRFLQDALAEAEDMLEEPTPFERVEIWVREGTYYPLAAFGTESTIPRPARVHDSIHSVAAWRQPAVARQSDDATQRRASSTWLWDPSRIHHVNILSRAGNDNRPR